ncbi:MULTISPECIES: hypothetical protein [Cytobacillus]|uniref:hypothetical protein n=1 Tax=Cytobacillus TaxID=2675230 RepID=UPI00203EF975|nr:hypothetical protein [Cytobacillus firmus]MCM3706939.1 hypothetical protein [Cytobacillus firmus]
MKENTNETQLGIFHSLITVGILFLIIYLIKQPNVNSFLYAGMFFISKSVVDIIFHKIGFTFRGTGIKKMLILNSVLLLFFIVWGFIK